MLCNFKSWELVKDGEFAVGDRSINSNGTIYFPGDDYPNDHSTSVYALYDTDQIIEKVIETKKKKKRI